MNSVLVSFTVVLTFGGLGWAQPQSVVAEQSPRSSEEWKAPARAARKQNPVAADTQSIAKGKTLYARDCLSCHGETGNGNGPAAKALEKPSGDFTDPKFVQESDGELWWKITEGRKPMPTFEKTLSEDERWHVINFVRSLAPAIVATPEFAVPEAHRAGVTRVLAAYFEFGTALQHDDPVAALALAPRIVESAEKLSDIDVQTLPEKARGPWGASLERVSKEARALQSLQGIAALRAGFRKLSDALSEAVAKFGHAEAAPLEEFQCQLAFDGAGATWLQRSGDASNPYADSKSSACGKLKRLLGGGPSKKS